MKTIDECSVATKRNNDLRTSLENGFCNIVNGEKIFISKTSPEIYPVATNQQLAAVSDVERALLALANSAARNAFPGWDAVPFERRKTILADVFNKIDENADELSARLAAKQGGTLAEAKWEIDLLTKSFGAVLVS